MDPSVPNSKSAASPDEREKIKRLVARLGYCGLANDTKWDEFITAMRSREFVEVAPDWAPRRPSFRFKCVDGPSSEWDAEWFYHLPFPMISVQWLDIRYIQTLADNRLPRRPREIDHSEWIENLLQKIGLEYQKGKAVIRIFGYSPKNFDLFDE